MLYTTLCWETPPGEAATLGGSRGKGRVPAGFLVFLRIEFIPSVPKSVGWWKEQDFERRPLELYKPQFPLLKGGSKTPPWEVYKEEYIMK